ncbi:MAG: DNA repair protein RadA [Bacteroidales bacterium]|nr:DNA repair protein RadA [Bacteroidales bacterium]
MAKAKTVFFCSNCGNEFPKWLGQCPACKEWNTLVEETVATGKNVSGGSASRGLLGISAPKPEPLADIDINEGDSRITLGIPEVDRILGGGIVKGSLVLLAGEPGIGKSTLSLQIPLSNPALKTLYVSGEESKNQIKLRSARLSGDENGCLIYCETVLENITEEIRRQKPDLVIIDSVQTMYCDSLDSSPGSVSQVREVTASLLKVAKALGVPVILIGHITKEGSIAGPKVLEHIVDVVLQFEGENKGSYRILRSIKNRFGATGELAVFEMLSSGLKEVINPSQILTPMHEEGLSGVAVSAMIDGSRAFLVEVQALVSSAVYGTAQRSTTGFDGRRLNMLLAVLEKRAGFKLGAKDVFLNIAGGLRVSDPACDMAIIVAVLSSTFDISIPSDSVFTGEIGLSGEIRPSSGIDRRINEAKRLGFKKIYISSYCQLDRQIKGIEIIKVADVPSLVRAVFKGSNQ